MTSGPPRTTTVGTAIQLAPRDPQPDEQYGWTIERAPDGSIATVGETPVVAFEPDVAGVYELSLATPGTRTQTVRVFEDDRRPARFELPIEEAPVSPDDDADLVIHGPFNDHMVGPDRPRLDGDSYVYETELPPGDHMHFFGELEGDVRAVRDKLTVPGPGRPQVRLDAELDGNEAVITATARAPPSDDYGDGDVTVEFYLDDRDDVDRESLSVEGHEARIPRSAIDGELRVHAIPVAERHGVADCVRIDTDEGSVARPNDPPEWARSSTIYEIFVREFAGGRLDTTFEQIEDRLPYLDWLGVDCLWLTPVLEGPTHHGYHITDYFDTASDLGRREEFAALVDACHERGIRVVFDLVINHTGADHPHFQLSAAGVDEYREWYDWEDGEAAHYFNWSSIPNLNFESLAVRRHLLDVVDEWAPLVDGFRTDVAWGVPHGFWREVRERVKEEDSEFLLLDEKIPHEPEYHEQEFDLHYDTTLYQQLLDVGRGDAPAGSLLDVPDRIADIGFPDHALQMRYVENHDEDRYIAQCGEAGLRAAAAATLTFPGVPMLYYGQERGMAGRRDPMAWVDGDDALTAFHRSLLRTRNDERALREGDLTRVSWDVVEGPTDRVVAFGREAGVDAGSPETDTDALTVVLNFGTKPAIVELPGVESTDLLTDEDVAVPHEAVSASETGTRVRVEDAVVCRRTD
ncbi:alpha-amylase family glycosyl hydrolase [Natronoarchaeum sp. GCM10025321]|uniref:alpha-amylase family glycosyl hydrolase n=1 Tax=Natronoarchaeum sp. GCM10025321 TaxID=3252684 RepID=UPI003617902D